MHKIILLICLLLTCCGCDDTDRGGADLNTYADTVRYRVATSHGNMGFVNGRGEEVIPCHLQYAEPFEGATAVALSDDVWVLIDRDGDIIKRFGSYDASGAHGVSSVTRIIDDLFAVHRDSGVSVDSLDKLKDEKLSLPAGVIQVMSGGFREGLLAIRCATGWGFIDSSGEMVIEPKYKKVFPFSEGVAAVATESGQGFIDWTGKVVIPFEYRNVLPFQSGRAAVQGHDEQWKFISKENEPAFEGSFAYVGSFRNGRAAVCVGKGEYWKIIDVRGEPLSDDPYVFIESYSEGRAGFRRRRSDGSDVWGYLDESGNTVVEFTTEVALTDYHDGVALIQQQPIANDGSERYLLIDRRGGVIWTSE